MIDTCEHTCIQVNICHALTDESDLMPLLLTSVCNNVAGQRSQLTPNDLQFPDNFSPLFVTYIYLCKLLILQVVSEIHLVTVLVCMCAWYVHEGVRGTSRRPRAGADRYEPDWAASSSWKLRQTHHPQPPIGRERGTKHQLGFLLVRGTSPCPLKSRPCGQRRESLRTGQGENLLHLY